MRPRVRRLILNFRLNICFITCLQACRKEKPSLTRFYIEFVCFKVPLARLEDAVNVLNSKNNNMKKNKDYKAKIKVNVAYAGKKRAKKC